MELTVKQEARRPGRPKVEGGRTRQHLLQIRISEEEHKYVSTLASQLEVSKNDILRNLLFNMHEETKDVTDPVFIRIDNKVLTVSKEEAKQILKSITEQLIGN